MLPNYVWGLVFRGSEGEVAMYNLPKQEAEQIEQRTGGELLCRPISTSKHHVGKRKLAGHKVYGV